MCAAALVLLLSAPLAVAQPVVNVAIVIDGPWERNEEVESRSN